MILDYNPSMGAYFVRVPRFEKELVLSLVTDHGLDLSTTASTAAEAVLVTFEPYAAAAFHAQATPRARAKLGRIVTEIEASWAPDSSINVAVPDGKELWGFQKADIAYALRRQNTLVADQPGLGKTPIAICFANEIKAKRILVLCPANIRLQWVKRIREWTTMTWPFVVHPILNARNGVHPNAQWTIVSYDLARTPAIGKALAAGMYDLLVLDECHYLKNIDSQRTRAIFGGGKNRHFDALAGRCGGILGLSGTPLPNRPREAYTIARAFNHDCIDWMSEDSFRERFNPSKLIEGERQDGTRYRFVDERTGRHAELQSRLRAEIMTRHMKRDVMTQLKMPAYDIVQLTETAAVKQALMAESMLDIDPENLEGADVTALGHVAVVRRQMGIALAPQVADYVDMLFDGGEEKLVLFAWHIEVLNMLEAALQRHGVLRVDGNTSAYQKQKRVEEFIKDPRKKLMIGNTLSLGTGTDGLQEVCNHGLIAEPDWVPGNNVQCGDRLDRGGQERAVQIELFVAPNSFAERILASALRKLQTTHKALDHRMSI